MINMAVIGYGYWGPNIARNFSRTDGAKLIAICDMNEANLDRARKEYPSIQTYSVCNDVLSSKDVDAIAIITPVSSHFDLAKRALNEGKHVFVEKPFTATVSEAEQLLELADKKNLMIMVDHTFLFTGAVRKMKEVIDNDVLGQVYYYDSTRINLGLFQHDVNVIWDLAPHDLSIMDYLIAEKPVALQATGKANISNMENIAFVTVHFGGNIVAHFNVNWMSPVKVRLTLVGGEKKMLVWNDNVPDEKLKIYDKGAEMKSKDGIYDLLVSYRSGDIWAPKVEQTEALKLETDYFVKCVEGSIKPVNDGFAGLRVVKMLEACDRSLRNKGAIVEL